MNTPFLPRLLRILPLAAILPQYLIAAEFSAPISEKRYGTLSNITITPDFKIDYGASALLCVTGIPPTSANRIGFTSDPQGVLIITTTTASSCAGQALLATSTTTICSSRADVVVIANGARILRPDGTEVISKGTILTPQAETSRFDKNLGCFVANLAYPGGASIWDVTIKNKSDPNASFDGLKLYEDLLAIPLHVGTDCDWKDFSGDRIIGGDPNDPSDILGHNQAPDQLVFCRGVQMRNCHSLKGQRLSVGACVVGLNVISANFDRDGGFYTTRNDPGAVSPTLSLDAQYPSGHAP